MRSYLIPVLAGLVSVALCAQEGKAQALALVKEGIAFLKANGKDKLLMEIQKGSGRFHVKPGSTLYLAAYDTNPKFLA